MFKMTISDVNMDGPFYASAGMFDNLNGMNSLQHLTIRNFQIGNSSFQNLTYLKHLVLFYCNLEIICSESFRCLPNLEVLENYYPEKYAHIHYQELVNLKWLHIRKVNTFDFLHCLNEDLIVLELFNSIMRSEQVFPHFNHPNLTVLQLFDNRLDHFDGQCLSGLKKLKHLKIGGNLIKTIQLNYDFLLNLETVSLDHNKLEILDNAFSKLTRLKSLDLIYNISLKLNSKIFIGLSTLEQLYLACVNEKKFISEIDKDFLFGLNNLTILDLKRNHLTKFHHEMFLHTPCLVKLDLSENSLVLEMNSFVHLKHLKFLDLSLNELKSLADGIFTPLRRLEVLSLYYNQLNELNRRTFEGLGRLRKLCLRENLLSSVKSDVFIGMNDLEEVDLIGMSISDRNINEISSQLFKVHFTF